MQGLLPAKMGIQIAPLPGRGGDLQYVLGWDIPGAVANTTF